ALMFSLLLRRQGVRVVYLGASLPVDAALDAVRRLCPGLFCCSAASAATAAAAAEVGRQIEALPEPRPRFGYGGRAFSLDPSLAQRMPGVWLGDDALQGAAAAAALLHSTPSA